MANRQGRFSRNGSPGNWGANLSRALWYSSKGSGGSAAEGRLRVKEFLSFVETARPDLVHGGQFEWWRSGWELELPNGVKLGFAPEGS